MVLNYPVPVMKIHNCLVYGLVATILWFLGFSMLFLKKSLVVLCDQRLRLRFGEIFASATNKRMVRASSSSIATLWACLMVLILLVFISLNSSRFGISYLHISQLLCVIVVVWVLGLTTMRLSMSYVISHGPEWSFLFNSWSIVVDWADSIDQQGSVLGSLRREAAPINKVLSLVL